jgi:hypothetical protein
MIRNCLGITVDDMKRDLFKQQDNWLLGWLLQQKCGGGSAGHAALSNFDAFNVFTAKKALDYLNNADARNGHLSGNDMYGFLRDLFPSLLSEFAQRECVGGNNSINDFIRPYKDDPYKNMYPSTITDAQKNVLLNSLQNSNFNATPRVGTGQDGNGGNPYGWTGYGNNGTTGSGLNGNGQYGTGNGGSGAPKGSGSGLPYIIVNENDTPGAGNLSDKTGDLFGDSILGRIPPDKIEGMNPDKAIYTKCFKTTFNLDQFLVPDSPESKPVITQGKIQNLKRIYDSILIPIYKYYYGDEGDISCKMRIHGGLTSMKVAYQLLGSSLSTKHITGEACNFSLVSVSNDTVIKDIQERRIKIDFGVMAEINGIFITLPGTFEGYEVSGVVLSSPTFDADNIQVNFS